MAIDRDGVLSKSLASAISAHAWAEMNADSTSSHEELRRQGRELAKVMTPLVEGFISQVREMDDERDRKRR